MRWASFLLVVNLFPLLAGSAIAQPSDKSEGILKIEGKLTADDPKDAVRKGSHHKVHAVKLEKDVVYRIDLISTQFDAYLRLEDAAGKQLEENDDGPVLTHSRIYFKPARAAEYRLVATTFKPGETGAYLLSVRPTEEKVLLGEVARRVGELTREAGQLLAAGQYGQAQKAAGKILEIRERVQGVTHWQTVNARVVLLHCEKLEQMPARDQQDYRIAQRLASDAEILAKKGRYAEAGALYQKTLEIRRRLLSDDHPDTASSYNNLAANLQGQGQHAEAGVLHRKALDIHRRLLGEDHPYTAVSYSNIALSLNFQGKQAEAEQLYQKALDIRRRLLGEDHPDTATTYSNIASSQTLEGKYAEAAPLSQRALNIRRRLLGEDHPYTALSYRDVAGNLDLQGKYVEAGPLYRKSLDICRRLLGENHQLTALNYDGLAMNLNAQGKYAEAAPLFQRALDICRHLLGADHVHTALSYNNLAFNLNAQGKYGEAENFALAALAGFKKARLYRAFAGLERTEFHWSPALLPVLQARLGKAADAGRHVENSLGRGLFDDLAGRHARPLSDEERQREASLTSQIHLLDQQLGALAGPKDRSEILEKQMDKLKERRLQLTIERGELQAALAKKYGPAAGEVFDLPRIQKHLPADSALVVWLDLRDSPEQADAKGDHWAMLLRARGEPVWVQLAGTATKGAWTQADQGLADQVRALLAGRPEHSKSVWQEKAALLARQRLAPLREHLGAAGDLPAVDKLIVLPSPALRGIPIEALLAAAKDAPALTVSYAPSGTLFAWLHEQNAKRRKDDRPTRLLALGDPVFAKPDDNKPKEVALVRGPTFQPLPGTRREVEAIAKLFPKADKFLGADASEERLDQLLADDKLKEFRYLHLATHGIIDARQPMLSFLALSQDKLPDPLERVLAGKTPYTGQLTAAHILRTWKLDADLVVLSACQTGLGKYEGGEGYVGFSQALLLSGARSLVLSQWSVDDTATALLMTRFYENLLGKRPASGGRKPPDGPMPKAKALQEAKNWLRNLNVDEAGKLIAQLPPVERGKERERPIARPGVVRPFEHPYFWAAFILIGDPD